MKLLFPASVLVSVVFFQLISGLQGDHHSQGDSCNEYIDGILRDLKEDKEYFDDPYEIPEKSLFLSKKLLFVNYTGEATIYDGYIFGMSSLHRDDDVTVDKKKSSTHLKMNLGAGELKMNCNGKVKLMGHGPTVKVEAKISYINMRLDIVPDSKGENPKVSGFDIETTKGTDVSVSGLGPLNIFLNAFIHTMGTFFKGVVRTAIESRIRKFLADKFKDYVVPAECLGSFYI